MGLTVKLSCILLTGVCAVCLLGCSSREEPKTQPVNFSGEQPSAPLTMPNTPLAKSTAKPKVLPRAQANIQTGNRLANKPDH